MRLVRVWAVAILFGIATVHGASAITFVSSTPIAGDSVPVTVTLIDALGGNGVDVTISIPTGQGDLLGFFGNATPETLVAAMAAVDPTGLVTQWQFAANQVWKVGGGNVMSPVKNWDFGLRFASQGSAGGAVTWASFRLTAPGLTTAGLTDAFNQGWRFGIRIQGTLGAEGSAKIGVASTAPPVGEAPTVEITAPADGALIGSSNVTVAGTVTGTLPVTVSVNGVAATVTGSTWSAALVLADGPHTLEATATNATGSATDSVAVTVDTTPPVVTITAPADGSLTTAGLVTVTGTVTDASPIPAFTVNGVAVSLADGAFTTTVALGLGGNPITAEATDAAGNTGSGAIDVIRGEAPAVEITAPADGLLTNQTPISVTGTIGGTAPLSVSVNGVVAAVAAGTWSASIPLTEGTNALAASATNAFGSASASVSLTLDTIPPLVAIDAPGDGTLTAASTIDVGGSVSDATSGVAGVAVNGVAATVSGGSFNATISLSPGANPITAMAIDVAGNSAATPAISVMRGEQPAIAITAPADGLLTNQTSIAVSGSVTGSAPLAVDVGGIAAAVAGGTWAATVPLAEGANLLAATLRNAFGTASDAVALTRDTTPPVVSITAPMSGATFTGSPVTVSGVVLDASAFALAVNGVAASVSGSSFGASVALTPGSNTLAAVATDAAGNAGSAGVTVTLQTATPLAMTIDSPPAGSLISADRVTVAGTVGDPAARVVVNGVTATVTGSQYVATNVPVVEGENLLTASATAAGGRAGQAAVSVTFNLPPKIMITSPRDGAALDVNELDVVGFVDDSAALVRVNGVSALVSSDGSFLAPAVPLAPNGNEITASAVDLLGAAGEDRLTVFYDEDGDEAALRLALVDPGRCTFPAEQSCDPVVLVARDLDEFRAGMERLNQPLGLFSSEALAPGVGDRDFQVYVFAEIDGSVSLDVEAVSSLAPAEPTQPLVPLAGLSADLLSIGLDPALEPELIPNDIDTAFFARFDLIGVVPFLAQDVSVQMETNEKLRNLAANPIGIGNQWTIMWHFLFPSVGTNPTFVELSAPGGVQADKIRLAWKGTLPRYFEVEIVGADGTSKKVWRWNNAFPAANFFMSPALVWDGAELRLYQSGFLDEADAKPTDDTVVQTDTPRRLTIENGSMVYHSLVVWDRALGQSEIAALQSFTGVITDLSSNAGAYSGAPNLEHWWRFGFDAGDVGKDYGNAAVPIDAGVDAVGIDASDVVAKRPPGFANLPQAGFAAIRAFLGSVSSSLSLFLDRSPPEVSITSPVAGSILAGNGVTVTGSVKDRAFSSGFADASPIFGSLSYRVTDSLGAEIAGGEVALHEGSFAIDDLALGEGLHCVAVTALDLGGNVGADEACFTTDPNAPAVTLVSPLDGTSLLETAIPVTLNFSTLTTLISVNGAPDGRSFGAGLASDVISLPLAIGANPTRLIFDAGSGPFELAFTLFRIDSFRDIQIVSPEQGAMRSGATVRVTGRAPRGTPAVQVNGINASIAADHVTFTADVPLHSGSNEIRAVELAFGRSDVVTVVRDDSAPKFLAIFPSSGAVTPDASVHFAGFVSEAARVTARNGATSVSAQAVPVSVPGDPLLGIPTTAYRFELPALVLAGGPNAIVLLASDRVGTETELSLTIVQDAGALSLVAPANGATVPALRTDLSFEASADLVIEAVYSGALRLPAFEGHAVGTGPFTLADVPLAPGPNELRVAYRRTSGGAQVLRFGLLSAAASSATIGGTVTDASSGQPIAYALVSLVVGGQTVVAATGADGRYSVPIEPGAVEVMATAGGFAPGMLSVTANSGSAVTADVAINSTGLPAFPNEVAIAVPPNGTVTDFERLTVVGTVLNPSSSVTVNGVVAQVVGNRFTAKHVPLAMGANTLTASAAVLGLPNVSRSVAIERSDQPVLQVKLFSPPEGARVPGGGLVVRGFVSAKDALLEIATFGSADLDEGVFEASEVFLPPGPQAIHVAATTPDGAQTAAGEIGVAVDTAEPALRLSAAPSSGEAPVHAELSLAYGVDAFPLGRIDFDTDGDGILDVLDSTTGVTNADLANPSTVVARALATTPGGVELAASARVHAYLPATTLREFALGNPVDLARGPNETLYVLDGAAGRVSRYDLSGTLLESFGTAGVGPEQLLAPQALAVAPDGRVYVADTGNDHIQVFDTAGAFERTIGSSGHALGQLDEPQGVAASLDRIYVADRGNARIQVFDTTGTAKGSFPLSEPRGFHRRANGEILVTSPVAGVLSLSGNRLEDVEEVSLLGPSEKPAAPVDIAVGSDSAVIVDAATGDVVQLWPSLEFRRRIAVPGRSIRAVLPSERSETESIYVADGARVTEIGLPVPSPIPTLQALEDRLAASDIEGALAYIDERQRPLFREIYEQIAPALPEDAASMQNFDVYSVRELEATLVIHRTETRGGSTVERDYPVSLRRQPDGSWRITDY